MGKLEEKSDGSYVLEARVGCVSVKMAFRESEKSLDEIPEEPKPNGFFLDIPDRFVPEEQE